jgi:hypothetical protein
VRPGPASEALRVAASRQAGTGLKRNAAKEKAKRRAAAIIHTQGGSGEAVDIGGHDWYAPLFAQKGITLERWDLPRDMHDVEGKWGGAVAMHTLEHSPFPLQVLIALRSCLPPWGWLYVSAPHPTRKWVLHEPHFTVLTPDGWQRLARDAGFVCMFRETGKFGSRSLEERYFFRAKEAP